MKKAFSILILSVFTLSFSLAQTPNNNLNTQLQLMKKYFLEDNYSEYLNFIYSDIIESFGGKEKMIELSETSMKKLKESGFSIIDITFKNPSKLITHESETQFTITQELLIQTPVNKLLSETTLIGVSEDKGTTWKFIASSKKSKDAMLKEFPNLSPDLNIVPQSQKILE